MFYFAALCLCFIGLNMTIVGSLAAQVPVIIQFAEAEEEASLTFAL